MEENHEENSRNENQHSAYAGKMMHFYDEDRFLAKDGDFHQRV